MRGYVGGYHPKGLVRYDEPLRPLPPARPAPAERPGMYFVDGPTDAAQRIAATVAVRPATARGGTFYADSGLEVPARAGFAVGAGDQYATKAVENGEPLDVAALVKAHLVRYRGLYAGARAPDGALPWHVGVWQDPETGELIIEPSEIAPTRGVAVCQARHREQKAVYDFAAGEVIYVANEPESSYEDEARAAGYAPPLNPSPKARNRQAFEAIVEAARGGDADFRGLVLVDTIDKRTGEEVAVLGVAKHNGAVKPLAVVFDEIGTERFVKPTEDARLAALKSWDGDTCAAAVDEE